MVEQIVNFIAIGGIIGFLLMLTSVIYLLPEVPKGTYLLGILPMVETLGIMYIVKGDELNFLWSPFLITGVILGFMFFPLIMYRIFKKESGT